MTKQKIITALAYGLPAIFIAGLMAFVIFKPIQVLPRIGLGPGFGLTDLNGNRITNETQRGKITLYTFTYSQCQTACPRLMEKTIEVQQRMGEVELGDVQVELVTISIDPLDTPASMAQYAANLGISTQSDESSVPWHFLTGENPELLKIMVSSGFDLYHEKIEGETAGEYQYKFVPMAVLIDGWGIIRAEYRQYEATERLSYSDGDTDIDPDILLRDIGLVANEANNSRGAAKAAYGAAHLFLCYPP